MVKYMVPAARRYDELRTRLFGNGRERTRAHVARALGLSLRTIERYEQEGAPAWYELALMDLAVKAGRNSGPSGQETTTPGTGPSVGGA